MKHIKKFNESKDIRDDLEGHDIFHIGGLGSSHSQYIIKKEIVEDYFSLIEDYGNVEIVLSVLSDHYTAITNDGFYISKVEDKTLYNANNEIAYEVKIAIKLDTNFYIDHGDSCDHFYKGHSTYLDIIKQLPSIENKIKVHNHSLNININGDLITCIIRNSK